MYKINKSQNDDLLVRWGQKKHTHTQTNDYNHNFIYSKTLLRHITNDRLYRLHKRLNILTKYFLQCMKHFAHNKLSDKVDQKKNFTIIESIVTESSRFLALVKRMCVSFNLLCIGGLSKQLYTYLLYNSDRNFLPWDTPNPLSVLKENTQWKYSTVQRSKECFFRLSNILFYFVLSAYE